MDLTEFVYRLKVAKESQEREEKRLQNEEDAYYLKISQGKQLFTEVMESLEAVIDAWEGPICEYLNELGKNYWSEEDSGKCEKVDKEEVKRSLYNICMCPIHQNLKIVWYVQGPPVGLNFDKRFPIFGVRLLANIKRDKRLGVFFDYFFQVLDNDGAHGHIETLEDLALTLVECCDHGPHFRIANLDWI